MGAQQAMQHAAARLKESATAEAGGIVAIDGEYRARIQYTGNAGSPKKIYGPRRCNECRAQADLETIRAAELLNKDFYTLTENRGVPKSEQPLNNSVSLVHTSRTLVQK